MVFLWSFSDSQSPQVSGTLLSILAVLSNAVLWIVFTHTPTSKPFRLFNNPLVTVPKAPVTIGIIITSMFHSFFNSLARSMHLSFFSHTFSFILWSARRAKSTILQIIFYLFIILLLSIIRSDLLATIRWSVCISKSIRSLCVLFSRCWVVYIPLVSVFKFKSFAHLTVNHLIDTVVSRLILHLRKFAAFAYYVIDRFVLFCWVLSILALIWLVLMSLSWAAIRKDSVSLLRFPFRPGPDFLVWDGVY